MMVERRFAKGDAVFRSGDSGDSMFVLLQGQIGIWLPAAPDEDAAHTEGGLSRSHRALCSAIWVCLRERRAPRMRLRKATLWRSNCSASNTSGWWPIILRSSANCC